MSQDYFDECAKKLSKCKQFYELWNIVQEKELITKLLKRDPKLMNGSAFFFSILMNRLGILDKIEKYLGIEFNEIRKLTIPYLREHGFIQEKEINGKKEYILITTPEEDR